VLTITIPASELFNEETQKFIYIEETELVLEHSLVSLSKWEQKWEKPFLGKERHTTEETMDYIKCMTLSPEYVSDKVYTSLSGDHLDQVGNYINAKKSATWFNETPGQSAADSGETITAEIIYYWLIALQIPFEVQHWHLNRLLTLVKVTNIKNDPNKKMMPKADAAAQQRMLNEQRKQRLGTKG
jgi:hypothetical protein